MIVWIGVYGWLSRKGISWDAGTSWGLCWADITVSCSEWRRMDDLEMTLSSSCDISLLKVMLSHQKLTSTKMFIHQSIMILSLEKLQKPPIMAIDGILIWEKEQHDNYNIFLFMYICTTKCWCFIYWHQIHYAIFLFINKN